MGPKSREDKKSIICKSILNIEWAKWKNFDHNVRIQKMCAWSSRSSRSSKWPAKLQTVWEYTEKCLKVDLKMCRDCRDCIDWRSQKYDWLTHSVCDRLKARDASASKSYQLMLVLISESKREGLKVWRFIEIGSIT